MDELSACGLFDCTTCSYRIQGTCPGCAQGNSFLETWGRVPCAIYSCAHAQGLESCRDCTLPVCELRGTSDNVCPLRAGAEEKGQWAWRIAMHLKSKGTSCHAHSTVPLKTLMRLRWYNAALDRFGEQGTEIISSRELADKLGVNSAMVRKDFSYFGDLGTPGLGYHVSRLQDQIRNILEHNTCLVVWIGASWLCNALGMLTTGVNLNFRIVAALDTRAEWIGKKIGEYEVLPLSEISLIMSAGKVDGAVLALPEDAQRATDALVEAGVRGILNLTPVTLAAPPEVTVRHVDLLGEMMALAVECTGSRA